MKNKQTPQNEVDGEQLDRAKQQLSKSQERQFPMEFEFGGRCFILHKDVFAPDLFLGSTIYVPHLPLKAGQSFLDMGCGTAVIGITACLDHDLSYVLCSDISLPAVNNAKENIKMHNLADKVQVVQSDVFSNIPSDRKFDLIFWNFPYMDIKSDRATYMEMCIFDPDYAMTKRFITEGFDRLNTNGRLMLGFSTTRAPLQALKNSIREISFDVEIYHQGTDNNGITQEILNVVKLK